MHPFEIFFHNNGDATFQTDDFCRIYHDMFCLATDFSVYQASGSTGWDGNTPQYRHAYDPEMERNGAYWYVSDETWGRDVDSNQHPNAQTFLENLSLL